MKVGLVQYSPLWEEKEKNREKILKLIEKNVKDISLLIFPEMTLTGFTMQAGMFAEKIEGKTFNFFSGIAKEKKTDIFFGLIEDDNGKNYNTLVHVNAHGRLEKKYRKIHPFSFSDEDKNYTRGEEPVITKVHNLNAGLSICYDLRFPELYRQYGKKRVDVLINIANWPVARIQHWRTLLKARAIENQCYMIGVNRVGSDPKLNYSGYSSVFDPMGEELIYSENKEEILVCDIQKEKVEETQKSLPFLDDIFLIKE
jgi:omega-amidase